MTATVLTVILNYRTAEMSLRAAQAALRAMEGVEGSITIVDNDSQDGSFETLQQALRDTPRVRVLQSGHNGGFGAGNNVAIRAGLPDGRAPDYVYLLNSDAFPEPDAIRLLRDYLSAHPECGFVGSHVRGEDDLPHRTAFRFPSVWSEFESAAQTGPITRLLSRHVVAVDLPDRPADIDWCAGASVMFPMPVLDRIGLFDEQFFLYFEETDLCFRIREAGYRGVYLPQARVVHIGSVSTGMRQWQRQPKYWFDSRTHYFRKRGGTGLLVAATLAHLAGGGIRKLRRALDHRPDGFAPYFLRDLMTETCRSLMPGMTSGPGNMRERPAPTER
ncbi:MAG: glycosyltransferase family 2 protein [Roseinatronobacter sp.]